MSGTVVSTIDISYTAPDLPDPMVFRPHLISTLMQVFESNVEVVCIEGQPGYGKTTLLREFAQSADAPCFSIFLKSGSRFSYDPVLARADLANQVSWHITSKRIPDDREPTDGELRTLWRRCAKDLIRRRTKGYVIVDGLYHIPPEDEVVRQAIISFLPVGLKPYRILFSAGTENNLVPLVRGVSIKSFPITTFAPRETDEYLADLVEDKQRRSEYHATLGGVPILLASVRRQFAGGAGTDTEQPIKLSADIDTLFDSEWELAQPVSELTETILSYVLAYRQLVTEAQLCEDCKVSKSELKEVLEGLPFVTYSEKQHGWQFTSERFRAFVERKLSRRVEQATEAIASKLLDDPDSELSLAQLPQYLGRSGSTDKLLEWFSEKRLARILLKTRDSAHIEPTLQKAIAICHDRRNDRALTTYSLVRSIVPQISQTTGIDNEIRARCALGDFEGAMAVANDVPLITQRLRLLAVLVDAASERPGFKSQPLLEEISDLLSQINIDELPIEDAIDLAIDLYAVDPSAALALLKQIIHDDVEEQSIEIAMARISLAALRSKGMNDEIGNRDSRHPIPTELLVDDKVRRFIEATRLSYQSQTSEEILNATAAMDNPAEKLFVLRKWVAGHPREKNILAVVELAINDAITAPAFAPNATFYREISTPLPHSLDVVTRRQVAAVLDGQHANILRKGPTIDYVRLQLRLAHCDYVDGELVRVADRLETLFLDPVDAIVDLEIKTSCLAWFLAELASFDPERKLDQILDVRPTVKNELDDCLAIILADGAHQFETVAGALTPLAMHLPEMAFEVAGKLNTIDRREQGYLHIIATVCDRNIERPNLSLLFTICDTLQRHENFDSAIEQLAKKLAREMSGWCVKETDIRNLLLRLDRCASSSIRTDCLAELASMLAQYDNLRTLANEVGQALVKEFRDIGSPRRKYFIGCKAISSLRRACPELASDILELFSDKETIVRTSENVEEGGYFILDLITKATCGLVQANLLQEDDLPRVCRMVSSVHDPYIRVHLFSTLAFFLWREKAGEAFSEVANHHLWPSLSSLSSSDQDLRYKAWSSAYPAVWLEDRDRARAAITDFPRNVVDECTSNLCFALLQKQPPGEPFEGEPMLAGTLLNYSDIQNLLHLCEETDEDFLIFVVCERIADEICRTDGAIRITRDQKAEVARRIFEIAETKLPVPERITHLGYQVICKAQALRIERAGTRSWQNLLSEGENLCNAADKAYVLAHLASYLPSRMRVTRETLFAKAETLTDDLRSIEDQSHRYCAIGDLIAKFNKADARRITEKAFKTLTSAPSSQKVVRERQVIDLAYRLDPELPMRLALFYDDDPARERYKERAREQLDRHQLRRDIGDNRSKLDLVNRPTDRDVASAAWQALGTLNSGRMIPTDMARVRDMLVCASGFPLGSSYPMYSWVLSNVMIKYGHTRQAAEYMRDVFDGIVRAAEFFFQMVAAGEQHSVSPEWRDHGDEGLHAVIGLREREKAVGFLKKWFEANIEEELTIVDPYFGPEDLWLIQMMMVTDPHIRVKIMTGKSHNVNDGGSLRDAYRDAWRTQCDYSPPETEVLLVRFVESDVAPFHDRWLFSKSAGLRIGTSFNSLGKRVSEISVLRNDELTRVQYEVGKYQNRQNREMGGERITYELFEL